MESFAQLLYDLIFFVRRYIMVIVLTVLPKQRNVQINIQLVSTLFVMSYTTYVLPFVNMLQNYQETMNEIWVLIASYHLFTFTEWVYELDTRFTIGWSLLVIVVLNVTSNIGIICFVTLKEAKEKTQKAYWTRVKQRIMKENERKREERR